MTTIDEVTLTPVTTPRTSGLVCGHVIVQLHTDDGMVGIGEMSDFQHLPRYHLDVAELQRTLVAMLRGLDPFAVNEIDHRLTANFPQSGSLYDKASLIVCGVDLACWDLRGKLTDRNVSELLGGRVRDRLPIAYPIFRQQSPADVAANLDTIATKVEQGFHRFRVYVGGRLDLDEDFLRRARDRFGDTISLKSLDFSNLLDAGAACRFIERTRELDYELVEAPAPTGDLAGLRFVRERTLLPVSEHVYSPQWALRLIDHRAVDILNVGLFALGGITGARRVLTIAEAAGIDCLVGTTQELAIGTAAAAQVGTTAAIAGLPADPVGPLLYTRDVVAGELDFSGGALRPPDGPGLGVAIDPDLLEAAHAPLTWSTVDVATIIDRTPGVDRVKQETPRIDRLSGAQR